MKKLLVTTALFSLMLGPQALATGEGAGRGGADAENPSASTAWFTGTRAIRYCLEASPDFGVSDSDLDQAIKNAFTHWRKYVEVKKVNEHRDPKNALVMNLAPRISCDGTQDLKFYFGSTPPEVQEIKSEFSNPIGFVSRADYDFDQGWAKGKSFVWVAPPHSLAPQTGFPDWANSNALSVVLLHEVGHLYGNKDTPGTIMRPDLVDLLMTQGNQGGTPFLDRQTWLKSGMIDGEVELYGCDSCSYVGKISDDPKLSSEAFSRFVGRDPVGTVQVTMQSREQGGGLIFADSQGSKKVEVEPMKDYSYFSTGVADIMSVSEGGGRLGRHLEVGVTHGRIRTGLSSRPVEFLFNLLTDEGRSPVQGIYFDGAQVKPLFKWVPQY